MSNVIFPCINYTNTESVNFIIFFRHIDNVTWSTWFIQILKGKAELVRIYIHDHVGKPTISNNLLINIQFSKICKDFSLHKYKTFNVLYFFLMLTGQHILEYNGISRRSGWHNTSCTHVRPLVQCSIYNFFFLKLVIRCSKLCKYVS